MDINVTGELLSCIWLTLAFGNANPVINYLIQKHGSAEKVRSVISENEDPEIGRIIRDNSSRIQKADISQCEKIVENCTKNDIGIVIYSDEDYPRKLLNIDNPPAVLYYKGNISRINSRALFSIVGTRNPSDYSRRAAKAVARSLAECGFDIVSGFAVGIDITSQLSAVSGGGNTYAVMGCGVDCNYPKNNYEYRSIISSHGAFISEYPPGTRPGFATFPPRNRIISGMSLGTAVIEAGVKSGSLITANHCNNQGKTLFVMPPHDIFDQRYGGNVALIRDGAVPLMSARDIVYEFYPENRDILSERAEEMLTSMDFINTEVYKRTGMGPGRRKHSADPNAPQPPLPGTFGHKKKRSKKQAAEAPVQQNENSIDLSALDGERKIIAEIIISMGRPVIADEIAAETNLDTSDVLSLLTDMELDGIITCGAGGAYTIS